MKDKVGQVALVGGGHEGRAHLGVAQPESMTNLVGHHLEEVDSYWSDQTGCYSGMYWSV